LDSLGFTPAALLGFEKKAALVARPLAYDVAKKLRACAVNHADETHYSIDGRQYVTIAAGSSLFAFALAEEQ
jgi:hypothetical protein